MNFVTCSTFSESISAHPWKILHLNCYHTILKANRPSLRNYPYMPPNYRQTNLYSILVIARGRVQTNKSTNGQTDGRTLATSASLSYAVNPNKNGIVMWIGRLSGLWGILVLYSNWWWESGNQWKRKTNSDMFPGRSHIQRRYSYMHKGCALISDRL